MEYKSLGDYYYNTQPIGQGSFSLIYQGYRIKDKKKIAIKKFTKLIENKYINSEIDLMKNLDNINILKLYEVIKTKKNLYLIIEYCNEGDLGNYIKKKDNSNDYNFIYQLISGLKYLYSNNILHRDIKPQNILIHNNIIKICDFGFAKDIKDNDLINTFCGSPLYMAPEIIEIGEYTEKADIWSLGVLIYEILFKKHPYPSKNHFELKKNIINNNININFELIDKNLGYILEKILDKNPKKRISWNEIFNSKWYLNYKNDNNLNENNDNLLHYNNLLQDNIELDENNHLLFNFDDIYTDANNNSNKFLNSFNESKSLDINLEKENNYFGIKSSYIPTKNNNINSEIKIYSKSAPNYGDKSVQYSIIYDNYICNSMNSSIKNDDGYNIVGESPKINNSGGWYTSFYKSINTVKNLFSI